MTYITPTHNCHNCGFPACVFNKLDLCPTCQRDKALAIEKLRAMNQHLSPYYYDSFGTGLHNEVSYLFKQEEA